jgi:hypothetical protein
VDELQALPHGWSPPGAAAVEYCAAHQAIDRELDAIRRGRSAQVGGAEGSWSIDWTNFYGKQ